MARYWSMTRDVENAEEVRELMRITEEQVDAAKLTSKSDEELQYRLQYLAKNMEWLRTKLAEFGGDHE